MTVPHPRRFQRYVTVLARWLFVTSVVFALTFFASCYFINHFLTKYYSATARIEIHPGTSATSITPAELETILSANVLLPVIKDQGLDVEWARRQGQDTPLTDLEAIATVDKMLGLESPHGTRFVDITVVDDMPREAADLANGVAEHFKALCGSQPLQQTESVLVSRAYALANTDTATLRMGTTSLPATVPPTSASPTLPAVMIDASTAPKPSPIVLRQSPVEIVTRAETPAEPFRPSPNFRFYASFLAAALFSLMISSFVEVMFLFLRAAEVAEAQSPLPETRGR